MPTSWMDVLLRLAAIVVALPVHEWAHAWVADRLGDETPRLDGRLTLDPRAHLDPWGALFLLLTGFGWARPVRFSPRRVRWGHPRGVLWVALAGPLANLALAALAVGLAPLLTRWGWREGAAALLTFAFLNALLTFFNLLPLPPLDGATVARELFPRVWARYIAPLEPYALLAFLALFWLLPRLGLPVLTWLVVAPARWTIAGLLVLAEGLWRLVG